MSLFLHSLGKGVTGDIAWVHHLFIQTQLSVFRKGIGESSKITLIQYCPLLL